MASGHALIFFKDLPTGAATGLTDANGNELGPVDLSLPQAEAYSKGFLVSPKAINHILVGICSQGCEARISLEMSPDGVNWCACNLSAGNQCLVECDTTISDCTAQTIDVSILQYVRVKIDQVTVSNGLCTAMLTYTLN